MSNFTDFIAGSGGGSAIEKDYVAVENINAKKAVVLRSDNKIENAKGQLESISNDQRPYNSRRVIDEGFHSYTNYLQLSPDKTKMGAIHFHYASNTRDVVSGSISNGAVSSYSVRYTSYSIRDCFIGVDNNASCYTRVDNEQNLTIRRNNSTWFQQSIQNSNNITPCGTASATGLLYVCRSTHLGSDGLCIFKINYDGTYGYGLRLGSTTNSSSNSSKTAITIDPITNSIYVMDRSILYKITDSGTAFTKNYEVVQPFGSYARDYLRAFNGNIVFKGDDEFVIIVDNGSSFTISPIYACEPLSSFDFDSSGILVRFGSDSDQDPVYFYKAESYRIENNEAISIGSTDISRNTAGSSIPSPYVYSISTNDSYGIFTTYNRRLGTSTYIIGNRSYKPSSTNVDKFIGFIEDAVTEGSSVTVKMKGSEFLTEGLTNGAYYLNPATGELTQTEEENGVFAGYAYNSTTLSVLGDRFFPEAEGATSVIKSIQQGWYQLTSITGSTTITPVNPKKAVVNFLGCSTGESYARGLGSISGFDGTTISFYRSYNNSATYIGWQVIEYV